VTSNITGKTTGAIRTGQGDVYAGRDGNVYRKQGGSWRKYDNGGWNDVGRARQGSELDRSPTMGQLNRLHVQSWPEKRAGQHVCCPVAGRTLP
jgi:hypothetical protein